MRPVLFKIGSLSFYTHGTFLVVGMAAAGWLMYRLAKKNSRNTEAVIDLAIFSLLAGVIFARLTYFFAYRDQFYSITDLFRIWEGGLVSWGGFVAGILTYLIILKLYREPFGPWLDILGLTGLLGIIIGRLGSFLSGEYAGKTTTFFAAIHGVHPVTIYEATILSIFFGVMLWQYNNGRFRKAGDCFVFVILGYGLVRFGLDFLRTDPVLLWGLTDTQFISALIAIIITVYLGARAMISKKGVSHARY